MLSIRGAITVEENSTNAISQASIELFETLCTRNQLHDSQILCVVFTCTTDLDAMYPATAVRTQGHHDLAFMCLQEMSVSDSLPMCIRVMVLVNAQDMLAQHVYLRGASALRPDLMDN